MEILLSGYSVQTTLPNSHPAALWFICIYIWHAQSERVLTEHHPQWLEQGTPATT
ncbi:hypothetical protein BDA96_01G189800 [Sorghum bicolor]|uniref:Uncharacterized protein n=2 Tax=Sorghum bicolor TaxID=4558 RepID=A0A921RZR0_SORBI|nr:hypothetical protein BDA96_01G189800 [Sorghum bicolor]OQU91445.1 hypothetical protein SORBI_3001G180950 [Sorghum bicolor]